MSLIEQRIKKELPIDVVIDDFTVSLLNEYREGGLESMRIMFYKEFEKNGFTFKNDGFWKIKNIIDEGE